MDSILRSEPVVRMTLAAAVFGLLAAWELAGPRRPRDTPRRLRWRRNLGLAALDLVVVRVVLPVTLYGVAGLVADRGWGLLNRVDLPGAAGLLLAVLLLDAVIYAQHLLFHVTPWLWRLHRVHHADPELDVSTGVRFHPGEILISTGIKMTAVAILGAPPGAVLIFEAILNATSLFNHANVRIAPRLEPILRGLVVTPDMHRVHHSILAAEQRSNFGFNFPWWDRLFGTYRDRPRDGHVEMALGLADLRGAAAFNLGRLLLLPFHGGAQVVEFGGGRGVRGD